jgi:hypothetical protein
MPSEKSIRERHEWAEANKQAAEAAKLPAATCAYTLRHSTITDLVLAGCRYCRSLRFPAQARR